MQTPSNDPQVVQDALVQFMDQHIYPNEAAYHEQLNGLEDRFSTVPLMEELESRPRSS